jgi:hypothetical protein
VRNFLVPLTVAEVQRELDLSVEMGDTVRAGYVEEFLRELEADFAGCDENAETPGLWN